MIDCLILHPTLNTPLASPLPKFREEITVCLLQSMLEQIRKQMMIPKPLSLVIQREYEQICFFKVIQYLLAVFLPSHSITQRPGKAVKDRSLDQKALDMFWLTVQNFFH